MRKILILIVCILFSASVFAGIVVKPFGGYTSVSNPSGNRILDMLLLSWSIPPEVKYKKTYFHDAYVVGVDVGYALIPGLDIGLRGEYIGCYGEVKAWNTGIVFQFCQQTAKELCISSPSPDSCLTALLS